MKVRGHAKILAVVTIAWAVFWVIGLPDYYQQYSFSFMLVFDAAVLVPLGFVVYSILRRTPPKFRMSLSLWLAFYITVPLSFYDYFYCGVYLGYGWAFLQEFWYLSVYYLIPWMLCPAIAYWMSIQRGTGFHRTNR